MDETIEQTLQRWNAEDRKRIETILDEFEDELTETQRRYIVDRICRDVV
jgi:hypothetical protein